MAGSWDADLTLLHVACEGGSLPADTVANGKAFDVVASVRIGRNLMQFVDSCDLFVSVRNLSRSCLVARRQESHPLAPQDAALTRQFRLPVDAGWTADEGDILEAVAALKVTAGVNPDYSLARSALFIVSAP
jgi:hypothetical protein